MYEFNKGVSNHSFLNEISRKNLVGKSKSQSPDRFNRRIGYHPKSYKGIDVERLLKDDIIIIKVPVGDYICTIAYKGVLEHLKDVISKQPKPRVTLQSVIKALSEAYDDTDILVDCTCPDFKYRFAYWATKYGYKYGKPETRPSDITNPNDKLGAMCKHLSALLANKRWLVKIASSLNDYIKSNQDEIRKSLGLSDDEFQVAGKGKIPKGSKFNKSTGKYELPSDNSDKSQDDIKTNTFSNEPKDDENNFSNKPTNDFKNSIDNKDDSDDDLELNDESEK